MAKMDEGISYPGPPEHRLPYDSRKCLAAAPLFFGRFDQGLFCFPFLSSRPFYFFIIKIYFSKDFLSQGLFFLPLILSELYLLLPRSVRRGTSTPWSESNQIRALGDHTAGSEATWVRAPGAFKSSYINVRRTSMGSGRFRWVLETFEHWGAFQNHSCFIGTSIADVHGFRGISIGSWTRVGAFEHWGLFPKRQWHFPQDNCFVLIYVGCTVGPGAYRKTNRAILIRRMFIGFWELR